MNNRPSARWAILVLGVAAAALRCTDRDVLQLIGSDLPERAAGADAGSMSRCVPGQTSACTGACGGGAVGYQVCAGDGRSYGACTCPAAGERPFIAIDPNSVLLSPEPVPAIRLPEPQPADMGSDPARRGVVGAACDDNANCQGALGCLDAGSTALAGGGVAGGYCTTDCADSEDCTAIDPLSACGTIRGQNMCVKLCLSQTPEQGEPKCLSRPELTCISLAALRQEEPTGERQIGICAPQCQSDASCGGRRCDLALGICTDTPRAGAPVGGACDEADECAGGVCLALTEQTASFCSAFCTLGVAGCGSAADETPGAACLFSQVDGEGTGDRGLCIEVCETAADCREPGSQCMPFTGSPRGGVCLRPSGAIGEPPDEDPPAEHPDAGTSEPAIVGATCEDDDDCSGGLGCLTSSSTAIAGGGVAGGYCTRDCSAVSDCTNIDPLSSCLTLGGHDMCVRLCLSQTPEQDESKCLLRPDLACVSVAVLGQQAPGGERQVGFCAPQCQSDASCGDRFCDLSRGICTDAPSEGAPIGGACNDPDECAGGVCLGLAPQLESSCSAFCTLGAPGCGFDSQETPRAACLFAQVPGEGAGDQGLCFEVCETAADCIEPGSACQPLSSSPLGGVCIRSTAAPLIEPPVDEPPGGVRP